MAPVRTDRDALSDHWRSAFDAADLALSAARYELPADELRELRRRLNDERAATMRVLDELAADPRWIRVLERLDLVDPVERRSEAGPPPDRSDKPARRAPPPRVAPRVVRVER
jgi:hypothetical protein